MTPRFLHASVHLAEQAYLATCYAYGVVAPEVFRSLPVADQDMWVLAAKAMIASHPLPMTANGADRTPLERFAVRLARDQAKTLSEQYPPDSRD
jgi:hypothetical protein